MYGFFSGVLMMACLVAGIFFLKFWKKTQDRLFIMFAFSFWLMSLERLLLGYIGKSQEISGSIYLIRFIAFALILIAIINKNREADH